MKPLIDRGTIENVIVANIKDWAATDPIGIPVFSEVKISDENNRLLPEHTQGDIC